MKTLSLIIAMAAALAAAGCGEQTVVGRDKVIVEGGLWYEKDSELPFTGVVVEYWSNGQQRGESKIRDGKVQGKVTSWFENGQKKATAVFEDGKLNGKWTEWYENGQKKQERTFRDDLEVPDSLKYWNEDGKRIR